MNAATAFALVRTDMDLADQIVQIGHACLEAGRRFGWPREPVTLVVCGVDSARQLRDVLEDARLSDIATAAFVEPDRNLGLTALCTEPIDPRSARCFRRLSLWRPLDTERVE